MNCAIDKKLITDAPDTRAFPGDVESEQLGYARVGAVFDEKDRNRSSVKPGSLCWKHFLAEYAAEYPDAPAPVQSPSLRAG